MSHYFLSIRLFSRIFYRFFFLNGKEEKKRKKLKKSLGTEESKILKKEMKLSRCKATKEKLLYE